MNKQLLKLKETLPELPTYYWEKGAPDLLEIRVQPTAIITGSQLQISGEDGNGFIDYYGEFRGGYPYIHPDLEAWALKNGGYWEWQHPGAIAFVAN